MKYTVCDGLNCRSACEQPNDFSEKLLPGWQEINFCEYDEPASREDRSVEHVRIETEVLGRRMTLMTMKPVFKYEPPKGDEWEPPRRPIKRRVVLCPRCSSPLPVLKPFAKDEP